LRREPLSHAKALGWRNSAGGALSGSRKKHKAKRSVKWEEAQSREKRKAKRSVKRKEAQRGNKCKAE
jgi:hypothetical protein